MLDQAINLLCQAARLRPLWTGGAGTVGANVVLGTPGKDCLGVMAGERDPPRRISVIGVLTESALKATTLGSPSTNVAYHVCVRRDVRNLAIQPDLSHEKPRRSSPLLQPHGA